MKLDWSCLTLDIHRDDFGGASISIQCPDDGPCEVRIQSGGWMEFVPWAEYKAPPIAVVPRSEIDPLVSELREVKVAAGPGYVFGVIHGTNYRLSLRCGLNEASFAWCGRLPEEWHALEPMVRALEKQAAYFDGLRESGR